MPEMALWLTAAGGAYFLWRRLLTFLHIAQQEEYHPRRFLNWWISQRAFDRRASLVLLLALIARVAAPEHGVAIAALAGVALIGLGFIETDPRTRAKKRLVMTKRATRIHTVSWGLSLAALAGAAISGQLWSVILVAQAAPLFIALAILVLSPVEKRVAHRFQREAMAKIRTLDPMVVAMTGSFGKTSIKHILGHVLAARDHTLITPGSVNSPLGVTRIIRERLTSKHVYFVAEMGAYGVGSIRRVCQIAPPKLSMLSTIGPAHYERFKSLEEVARAKIEIAEEAIKNGGRFITPAALMQYEAVKAFVAAHPDRVILCGPGAPYEMLAKRMTRTGVEADIRAGEQTATLAAPIYGLHQADNVFLAAVAALEVGMPLADVVSALASTPQITHRCEVKPSPAGPIIIDDSYNANPSGFLAALEVLDSLKREGGRRIVLTPGMVELGALHDAEHRRLGEAVARRADLLVAVTPERIAALIEGYEAALDAPPDETRLRTFASFSAARAWLDRDLHPEDVVLIENDLPDLYEMRVAL